MTTTTLMPPPLVPIRGSDSGTTHGLAREPESLFDGPGGGPSLDDVVSGAWEGLAARAVVDCPLCGGELAPEFGPHTRPIGGRCRRCGTTLS